MLRTPSDPAKLYARDLERSRAGEPYSELEERELRIAGRAAPTLLVNERFVPLWYVRGMDAPFVESYGVSRSAFGKAFLAMTAEGDVLFQTHELDDPSVAHEFLRRRRAACAASRPRDSPPPP